jgi:hypothetical protein
MTAHNDAPRLFLLGDSIIHNEWYVDGHPSVTDEVQKLWPNPVQRIAWDGHRIFEVEEQYEGAIAAGFNPSQDVLALSVMGNDLRVMLGVYEQSVTTVAEGMVTAYRHIEQVFARYDALVATLRSRGVKHLVLVSIYPIYDMSLYAGERVNFNVNERTGSWVLMTPVLGMVARHIIDTAKKHGAEVADLFSGDFGPEDIVRSIEPGPSASPKVARIIVEAAKRTLA